VGFREHVPPGAMKLAAEQVGISGSGVSPVTHDLCGIPPFKGVRFPQCIHRLERGGRPTRRGSSRESRKAPQYIFSAER